MLKPIALAAVLGLICLNPPIVSAGERTDIDTFLTLTQSNAKARVAALEEISQGWQDDDVPMMLEAARFAQNPQTRLAIFETLRRTTGQSFGNDLDPWYQWIWNQPRTAHPRYATFKQQLYQRIDPRFSEYFDDERAATIELDEIRWGGVLRDGIPPLKEPETISAAEAIYLDDSDVVFGVEFGGQARAYPKRILAWHEMVKDTVGGRSINGVYCTLCGSMIVYDTIDRGQHYELGTSGFLYRSNKLMYDHDTQSMWSTLQGKPVVGPLVGSGIKLKTLAVVTTTWGKWRATHPDTDVLSLRTGHRRDYGEGVAYHDYFATDQLMFTVPKLDRRLKNKDEVLIVGRDQGQPIAIAADFLRKHPVYAQAIGDDGVVVLTDSSGANRVYQSAGHTFTRMSGDEIVLADDDVGWRIDEVGLHHPDGKTTLERLPAHRAFWFGWSAANPGVQLVN